MNKTMPLTSTTAESIKKKHVCTLLLLCVPGRPVTPVGRAAGTGPAAGVAGHRECAGRVEDEGASTVLALVADAGSSPVADAAPEGSLVIGCFQLVLRVRRVVDLRWNVLGGRHGRCFCFRLLMLVVEDSDR